MLIPLIFAATLLAAVALAGALFACVRLARRRCPACGSRSTVCEGAVMRWERWWCRRCGEVWELRSGGPV